MQVLARESAPCRFRPAAEGIVFGLPKVARGACDC
jgi:hypothetical protein